MNVGRSTPKQDESIRRTESDEKSLIKTATKVLNSESLGKKGSEDDLLTKPGVKTKSDPVSEDDITNNVVTKPSSWEEELQRELLLNMPRTHSVSQKKGLPAYARFKIFRREIYGLALVDTGNLVKATLVSKEFWDEVSGDIEEQCNFSIHD